MSLTIPDGSINSITALSTPSDIQALQSNTVSQIQSLSTQSSQAVSKALGNDGVNQISTTVSSATTKVTTSVNALKTEATNFLNTSISSITSAFSKSAKDLASTIDGSLSSIFKDTNVKSSSTTNTKIADAVATNLVNGKLPDSSGFKVSSLDNGTQKISLSGSSSKFGTDAQNLIGTDLSTVLNRFNVDTSNLKNSLISSQKTAAISSLFSDVKSSVSKVTSTIDTTKSSLTSALKTASTTANDIRGLINTTTNTINEVQGISNSIINDAQSFLGKTNNLTKLTGVNSGSFFVTDDTHSLLDENNNIVSTSGNRIDATTANSLMDIARDIGCTQNGISYRSLSQTDSLYNYILNLSSSLGFTDLLQTLLGCSFSSTTNGQSSLKSSFVNTVGTDLLVAGTIIDHIVDKGSIYTPDVGRSIVQNPNLSASDLGTVATITNKLGTTTEALYRVPDLSTDIQPVYDINALLSSNKSFVDGLFEDQTLTTYTNGVTATFDESGYLMV